jgi:dolichyl-phosphate beta-glucosyltransferase|tara:strand:+ start:2888 stop:3646 length:759 start_codon:yes stop_codon:yes gene_type:complete
MKELKKYFKKDHTSIIIPLYNEEVRLDYCFDVIEKFLKKNVKFFFEIIFVNDGSNDQSKNKILKFINKNKKVFFNAKIKLISYTKNVGKGYAIKKGILIAKSKWILTCDLDMSVLPEQYLTWKRRKLIKDINCAYIASRSHKNSKIKSKFIRRRLGGILKLILYCFFNLRISDTQCGFKVFHSSYIKKIFNKIKCYDYVFDVETMLLLNNNNIKIVELPVTWAHRSGSKIYLIKDSINFLLDLLILKRRLSR